MARVSASLLGAEFSCMEDELLRAQAAGVDSFHVDFMDGHYVPNLALAPYHLHALKPKTELPFEIHLELANPDQLLDTFQPFPADVIIVQWDTCPEPDGTFQRIRQRGARVGLGLLPLAPIAPLMAHLGNIDMLLLLGVQPGFGGQEMVSGTQEWLGEIGAQRNQHAPHVPIAIDGGVKPSNAEALVLAGADILVMGSGLFEAPDMAILVKHLHSLLRS